MLILIIFCLLTLFVCISMCFSPTGNIHFLGDDNKKVQWANWIVFLACLVLANLVNVIDLHDSWLSWAANLAMCVIIAVIFYLFISCGAMMWQLFKSLRNALKS